MLCTIMYKAVGPGLEKNPKLISVGLTFIPEPRVSPILEFEDQIWEYVFERKICEFARLCHEYEVLDLFSCVLVKPQVVITTTTIKPKPENDQKGEFCFLFICITL